MKKFLVCLVEWKTAASLLFTGSVILCSAVMLLLGQDTIPVATIASLLIVSSAGTFIQFLAFNGCIIKNMRYTLRLAVFAAPFFMLLALNAWLFSWFPMDKAHWLYFSGIFLAIFVLMTVGFEIYFRAMGRKYDGLLGQYRRQKESQKSKTNTFS